MRIFFSFLLCEPIKKFFSHFYNVFICFTLNDGYEWWMFGNINYKVGIYSVRSLSWNEEDLELFTRLIFLIIIQYKMIFESRCCFAAKCDACSPNVEVCARLPPSWNFENSTKKLFINIIKFVLMNKDMRVARKIVCERFKFSYLNNKNGKFLSVCHIADIIERERLWISSFLWR